MAEFDVALKDFEKELNKTNTTNEAKITSLLNRLEGLQAIINSSATKASYAYQVYRALLSYYFQYEAYDGQRLMITAFDSLTEQFDLDDYALVQKLIRFIPQLTRNPPRVIRILESAPTIKLEFINDKSLEDLIDPKNRDVLFSSIGLQLLYWINFKDKDCFTIVLYEHLKKLIVQKNNEYLLESVLALAQKFIKHIDQRKKAVVLKYFVWFMLDIASVQTTLPFISSDGITSLLEEPSQPEDVKTDVDDDIDFLSVPAVTMEFTNLPAFEDLLGLSQVQTPAVQPPAPAPALALRLPTLPLTLSPQPLAPAPTPALQLPNPLTLPQRPPQAKPLKLPSPPQTSAKKKSKVNAVATATTIPRPQLKGNIVSLPAGAIVTEKTTGKKTRIPPASTIVASTAQIQNSLVETDPNPPEFLSEKNITGQGWIFHDIASGIYSMRLRLADRPRIQLSRHGLRFGPFEGDNLNKMKAVLTVMRECPFVNTFIPSRAQVLLDSGSHYIFYPFKLKTKDYEELTGDINDDDKAYFSVSYRKQKTKKDDSQELKPKKSKKSPSTEEPDADAEAPKRKKNDKGELEEEPEEELEEEEPVQDIVPPLKSGTGWIATQGQDVRIKYVKLWNFNIARLTTIENTTDYYWKLAGQPSASQEVELDFLNEEGRFALLRDYCMLHYVLTGHKAIPYFTTYKVSGNGGEVVLFAVPDIFGGVNENEYTKLKSTLSQPTPPASELSNPRKPYYAVAWRTKAYRDILENGRKNENRDIFITNVIYNEAKDKLAKFTPEVFALSRLVTLDMQLQRGGVYAFMFPPFATDVNHKGWFKLIYRQLSEVWSRYLLPKQAFPQYQPYFNAWKIKLFEIVALVVLADNNYLFRVYNFKNKKNANQREWEERKTLCLQFITISQELYENGEIADNNQQYYNEYIRQLSINFNGEVQFEAAA